MSRSRAVLVIAGPTAVGKSAIGISLARQLGAEIISADSRQVYRQLDIGTAKPTLEERSRVRHHLIDILDPDQPYSAAAFARDARAVLDGLDRQNQPAIVVGGSGLYLRALIDGLSPIPAGDETIRQELRDLSKKQGREALHDLLRKVDPESANRLRPNDSVRIIRAMEVHRISGRTMSEWQRTKRFTDGRKYFMVVLDRDRGGLYRMIDERVDWMLAQGLVDEVKGILAKGYDPDIVSLRTVGYRELIDHLQGKQSYLRAMEQIKQNTRRFAKRQLTWFRSVKYARWVEVNDDKSSIGQILQNFAN